MSRQTASENGATVGFEAKLWAAADALRNNMDAWRGDNDADEYADVPGFCMAAKLDDIRKHLHVLTPGRYVGTQAAELDGEPFEEKMTRLAVTLRHQQEEAEKLDATIAANLKELGFGG